MVVRLADGLEFTAAAKANKDCRVGGVAVFGTVCPTQCGTNYTALAGGKSDWKCGSNGATELPTLVCKKKCTIEPLDASFRFTAAAGNAGCVVGAVHGMDHGAKCTLECQSGYVWTNAPAGVDATSAVITCNDGQAQMPKTYCEGIRTMACALVHRQRHHDFVVLGSRSSASHVRSSCP